MSYGPVGTTDRLCDWPACPASYDALAVMEGNARAPGWRMHRTFGLHMCGEHAPLTFGTGDGPHCPRLDHGTSLAACSCGAQLTTERRTLGQIEDAYCMHLIDADGPADARTQAPGTPGTREALRDAQEGS